MVEEIIPQPKIIERFIFAAQRAGATTERIPHAPESLKAALLGAVDNPNSVILAEPDDLPSELFTPFRQIPGVIVKPTEDQLASAQTGITDAFAGIARTGSVCVSVTDRLGGAISLFTRTHIAVLEADSIVPRPRDLFSAGFQGGKALKRNFVIISGPSATADMGPLVRGVHGPGRLHIIILE